MLSQTWVIPRIFYFLSLVEISHLRIEFLLFFNQGLQFQVTCLYFYSISSFSKNWKNINCLCEILITWILSKGVCYKTGLLTSLMYTEASVPPGPTVI